MTVPLYHIYDLLMPGMQDIHGSLYVNAAFDTFEYQKPLGEPRCEITLPTAVALGISAAVISNPVVTRRIWLEKIRSLF